MHADREYIVGEVWDGQATIDDEPVNFSKLEAVEVVTNPAFAPYDDELGHVVSEYLTLGGTWVREYDDGKTHRTDARRGVASPETRNQVVARFPSVAYMYS